MMTQLFRSALLVLLLLCIAVSTVDAASEFILSDQAQQAVRVSQDNFIVRKNLPIDYSIFEGKSCLRGLAEEDLVLFQHPEFRKTAIACLLLMRGLSGAAHEVLLGVTPENLAQAEYAATHPGKTSWQQDHPLSTEDDMLHSLIHMWEGDLLGEGNQRGWENSKYWAAGGPKNLFDEDEDDETPVHPIHAVLLDEAKSVAPICFNQIVCQEAKSHTIIAGGGKFRKVIVRSKRWDPFRFIDLCSRRQEFEKDIAMELDLLQEVLLKTLIRFELLRTLKRGGGGGEIEQE